MRFWKYRAGNGLDRSARFRETSDTARRVPAIMSRLVSCSAILRGNAPKELLLIYETVKI